MYAKIASYELSRGEGHRAGSMPLSQLEAIARHCPSTIDLSVETGCGKSTILFSCLSNSHLCFAFDDRGYEESSVDYFLGCPASITESCQFIFGPSQQTLPSFKFEQPIDVALIDGPHGFPFPQLEYYYLYPHMRSGSLLVLDDIQIPHLNDMFKFLASDEMWSLIEIPSGQTAIFRRTSAQTVNRFGDDWWQQAYNRAQFGSFFWGALPPNGTISFGAGGNCRDYLAYGWSFQEDWGRWSEGKEAALSFSCSNPGLVQGPSEMSLICRNLCKVEVYLNDLLVAEITPNELADNSLRKIGGLKLPSGSFRANNEINLLRFRVSGLFPSEQLGARQLGIAVSGVQFR